MALPSRWCALLSIWRVSTLRLQPASCVLVAYHNRSPAPRTFSSKAMLWPQGICATTCCTTSRSGQAAAKARMYFRFRGENPRMSGNAPLKSCASRSMVPAPHPSRDWRGQDRPADVPIERHHCAVGGQHDTDPLAADALLGLLQKFRVVGGQSFDPWRNGNRRLRAAAAHHRSRGFLPLTPLRRHRTRVSKFRLMVAARPAASSLSSSSSR